MKLLTKKILKSIPMLGSQDVGNEAIAYAKFFNPTGVGTWYATEFDPETGLFFGMTEVGAGSELGYFSLEELTSFRGRFGLGIERDLHFSPRPLKELCQ